MAEFPDDLGFSLSHTTRDPRPGEQVGDDYHLVNREKMQGETDAGPVVEHAEVHICSTRSHKEIQSVFAGH